MAVFGSIISFYTAFHQVDPEKEILIRTLGGNRRDIFFKVVLPGSVPTLLSTTKVNIGLSLVGVIIGEFLAARRGLGYLIIYGSQVFQLDMVISSISVSYTHLKSPAEFLRSRNAVGGSAVKMAGWRLSMRCV